MFENRIGISVRMSAFGQRCIGNEQQSNQRQVYHCPKGESRHCAPTLRTSAFCNLSRAIAIGRVGHFVMSARLGVVLRHAISSSIGWMKSPPTVRKKVSAQLQRSMWCAVSGFTESAVELSHVRFTPKSGHVRCTSRCLLWANSGHSVNLETRSPAVRKADRRPSDRTAQLTDRISRGRARDQRCDRHNRGRTVPGAGCKPRQRPQTV
jgi:hypothetical protein